MRLTVVFIFLFWGVSSFAQTYPVHVQVNVSPPYSFYLSDYVSGSRERVSVTLLNRDVQYSSMPVRLRLQWLYTSVVALCFGGSVDIGTQRSLSFVNGRAPALFRSA